MINDDDNDNSDDDDNCDGGDDNDDHNDQIRLIAESTSEWLDQSLSTTQLS